MLRPREALARYCVNRIHRANPGFGRTIALIDGRPDLETEDLVGANVVTRSRIGRPDPHATFAACVLVGQRHGLIPRARLLAAAITATEAGIEPAHVAAALDWARRSGAEIIVVPLGDHHDHADVGVAVNAALAAGIVIVAAAGNAHPHPLLFPARLPGVIAVGACDEHGALLEDSCRTPRLDLVAPGLRILAATGPGREAQRSGTSVAAAMAGGVLMLDLRSAIDPHTRTPS